MNSKKLACLIVLSSLCAVNACDSSQNTSIPVAEAFESSELPIINGTLVTGNDRLSTVALVLIQSGQMAGAACTGTLITPNYVLIAGHCVAACEGDSDDKVSRRKYTYIGIGQSYKKLVDIYPVEDFIVHPDFVCGSKIYNDIAILKLAKSVPASVAVPTPPLLPELALTVDEVDSEAGVDATSVGFGKTDSSDDNSMGVKYETTRKVYAVCPLKGAGSKECGKSVYYEKKGILYLDIKNSATCQGDSGGPTFIQRNGREYVAGVTSYSYADCSVVNGMTLVTDYYDFIKENVDVLPAVGDEDCTNGKDDNGDNLVDCNDPYCFGVSSCFPEDCANGRDDNGNNLIDCADPLCAGDKHCQPEICDNNIDDNEDGKTDCQDPVCSTQKVCQPEICDNGIDDNEDGKKDCEDPKCASTKKCQPEICNNNIDDNDNGLKDCEDPSCKSEPVCQSEICNDNIDNNGNGLIDCADPECRNELICQPEICNDNIDNNGNNLIDCADPSCAAQIYCQPEICNNNIDDNQNGLTDCADPLCASDIHCQPEICSDNIDNNGNGLIDCDDDGCAEECSSSSSGCSISAGSKPSPWTGLLLAFAALPMAILRRRKQQ